MDQNLLKKKALANWNLVDALAKKRFQKQETAEEAALYVLEILSQEQWQRLDQYSGKSAFTTYFTTVVYRLLEDYSRKRFGRASVPQWIKKLGGIWLVLYRILCLERFSFTEAIHLAQNRMAAASLQMTEQAAEEILARVIHCGKAHPEDQDQYIESSSDETPFTKTADSEEAVIRQILCHIFFGDAISATQQQAMERIFTVKLSLEPAEQLLLKLCYRDGLSQVEAGKLLGLNRFQINGRIRRTLAKIKTALQQAGLAEELQLILTPWDT